MIIICGIVRDMYFVVDCLADGLMNTTRWLKKHCDDIKASGEEFDLTNVGAKKALIARVITAAYMELLDWTPDRTYPEAGYFFISFQLERVVQNTFSGVEEN